MISNTIDNGIRTVHLQRALDVGDSNYYTFLPVASTIDLIGAWGTGSFGFHGSNVVVSSITLTVPEPGSLAGTSLFGGLLLSICSRRRRRRAWFDYEIRLLSGIVDRYRD